MAISASVIAHGAVAAVGAIVLVIAAPTGCAGQSALAASPTSVPPAPAAEAPAVVTASSVAASGVTLRSVDINLPESDATFPGGAEADAINSNCLICHSAGMVLTQPSLSRADWQAEVEKMRNSYKAPIAAKDVPPIVNYLAKLSEVIARTTSHRPDAMHSCARHANRRDGPARSATPSMAFPMAAAHFRGLLASRYII